MQKRCVKIRRPIANQAEFALHRPGGLVEVSALKVYKGFYFIKQITNHSCHLKHLILVIKVGDYKNVFQISAN